MYEAELRLLISEGAFTDDGRPRPSGELREFVRRAVFAPTHLDPLIEKHDLVARLKADDLDGARSKIRKLLEINTGFNYFESYRESSDPPRTARVTATFSAPDPTLALAVARDVGQIIAETQTARAAEIADAQVEGLRILADETAGKLVDLEKQLDRAKEAATGQANPLLEGYLQQLTQQMRVAEAATERVEADLVDAQLRARSIRQAGPLVQVVDAGLPFWRAAPRAERLLRQGMVAIVAAAIAALLLVGAFDPTVLDEGDLRRAGLKAIGSLSVGYVRPPPGGV